jgi:hypothetical protein
MPQPNRSTVVHHASGSLEFMDSEGVLWTVSEIARMNFSEQLMALLPHPERRQGWLLFESQYGDRRRFTPIPDGWQSYAAAALEGCLSTAVRASAGEQRRRTDQAR